MFNKKINLVFIGLLVLVLSSCWSSGSKDKAKNKFSGIVVVNVLDKDDYDDCHIKGSINIPFEKFEAEAQNTIENGATVIVYCSNYMCGASSIAKDMLLKWGYDKVYAYEGGTAEWFQRGYPVEGPCKKAYLTARVQEPEKIKTEGYISAEELKKKLEENKNI